MSDINMADAGNANTVDNLLSEAMLSLSVHDRTAIHEEMHGVRSLAVPETPELLSRSLKEFQRTIDGMKAPSSKMKVYRMILDRRREEIEQNRLLLETEKDALSRVNSKGDSSTLAARAFSRKHYAVDDDDFRLRFLRVELFDVPKAVDRFLAYLDLTYDFWGDVVLERPVYISDLMMDKQQRTYIKKGYHQILPFRDRSGRKVMVDLRPYFKLDDDFLETMFKVMFYVNDAATRDCVESQRMGSVCCFETHNWETGMMSLKAINLCNRVMESIPNRYVALHMCIPDNPFFYYVRNTMFRKGLGALSTLLRLITTIGTELECRYKLKSYGIPTELYPLTLTGNFKLSCHQQWMKTRQLLEEKEEAKRINKPYNRRSEDDFEKEEIVECPCVNDVTFRRGTSSLINPGNVTFRAMMLNYFQEKNRRTEERQQGKNSSSDSPANMGDMSAVEDGDNRKFCESLIDEIEINRDGRFLVWDQSLTTWTHLRGDNKKGRHKLRQKVMIALYNCEKLVSTLGKKSKRTIEPTKSIEGQEISDDTQKNENNYQFLEGGERPNSSNDKCCFDNSRRTGNTNKRYKQNMS